MDEGMGKASLLRTLIRGIVDRYTPKDVAIVLVDHRKGLLGFSTTDHLLAYAVAPDQFAAMMIDIRAALAKRVAALRNGPRGGAVVRQRLHDQ
jgi:S-DNA-T family DNA segregation ATPase FtsK/SpoIIIE